MIMKDKIEQLDGLIAGGVAVRGLAFVATRDISCNLCGAGVPAVADCITTPHGQWGYVCVDHFRTHGVGIGKGLGQAIIRKVPGA
jgi:hypothetical protein